MNIRKNNKAIVLGALAVVALGAGVASEQAAAHGYMTNPPSRAYVCNLGGNTDCGPAQYEPFSVGEGPKGFPARGPADGQLASGGLTSFAAMNAQSANRWRKTLVTDREVAFDWRFTAAHKATRFEYFITRMGWNPNEPLSRASFDPAPFCTVEMNGGVPTDGPVGGTGDLARKHACTLPADRDGYHVIFGAWTVDDTPSSFYNAVDVDIQADDATDGWKQVGSLSPMRTLIAGDTVTARAFTGSSESAQYSVPLAIATNEQGEPANWSLALAQKLNAAQPLVRAGVRNEQGQIEPVRGVNSFFAQAESGVTSYQMQFDLVEDTEASAQLQGLHSQYTLDKGRVDIAFNASTNRALTVDITLFDAQHKAVGHSRQVIDNATAPVTLAVRSAPGAHQLKMLATSDDGRINLQDQRPIALDGQAGVPDYDHLYPEGIEQYVAGTRVLQVSDDQVYQCKPFPAEGWCRIRSSGNHYEPGIGANWQDAWTRD